MTMGLAAYVMGRDTLHSWTQSLGTAYTVEGPERAQTLFGLVS